MRLLNYFFCFSVVLISSCSLVSTNKNTQVSPQKTESRDVEIVPLTSSVICQENSQYQQQKVNTGINVVEQIESYKYSLGTGDEVSLKTKGNTASSPVLGKYIVGSEGEIDIPIIGPVKIAGLTVIEARNLLSEKLSGYIKNNQDLLFDITEYASKSIIVSGAVNHPVRFHLTKRPVTILDALNKAGGINQCGNALSQAYGDAEKTNQQVCGDINAIHVKQADGNEEKVSLDALSRFVRSSNKVLTESTVITVPVNQKLFFVGGGVNLPGAFNLFSGMNLAQALSFAGDIISIEKTPYVYILRSDSEYLLK